MLLVVLAVGNFAGSGSATAASRIGTLVGTAAHCTGYPRLSTDPPRTWRVRVVLEEGTKIVGRRTVTDSWRSGHNTERPFTFRVPAGTYVVASPPPQKYVVSSRKTVVIEAGKTTKVKLSNICD